MPVAVSYPGVYVEKDASPAISPNTLDTADSGERDIGIALQSIVFESNNQSTLEKVRNAFANYLYNLRKCGALVGGTEKEVCFF
ncbi:hypothetical protein [Paraburkholderia sp. IW21]|uniref:hypothetical protein n=1 Tax=Paraburkholderia sp. IW21 TaxID=3242488 RepID=UPI0035219B3F